MQKCSNSTRLNGWMHSKQTGEKQIDKLIGRGIMSGWTATENFWLDDIEWLKSWRKFFEQLLLILTHSQARKKLVNEGTTTIHVVKWVGSWRKNYLLLETQSKAKCLTMQIFNLHFALNFVKVSVLSVMRYIYVQCGLVNSLKIIIAAILFKDWVLVLWWILSSRLIPGQ